jgi:DNA-directed RNA polymerase specialized sigma subunit
MNHFCNCKPENPEQFTNKFRLVNADKDGVCYNCGHYTLCSDKEFHYVSNVENTRNTQHSMLVVDQIRQLLLTGMKGKDIAKALNVSPSMVSQIKNNKSRLN